MTVHKKQVKYLFFKRLLFAWMAFHFFLFLVPLYPLFLLLLSHKSLYRGAHLLRKIWGAYLLTLCGMRFKAEFEVPLDRNKTYIFAPNHSSYLDIPALTVMLPFYLNFMAKEELKKVPFFGIFFYTIDIAVNRKNAIKAHKAFLKATERLKNGASLLMFPEGTITASAPALGRFKDGPFKMAIDNQVEIVPVTLPDNFYRFADDGNFAATPGKMRMYVHRPIPVAHLNVQQVDELKQEVFRIIESKLEAYAGNERNH